MSNLTASQKELNMTDQTPLPLRNDTILGVCEAIGREFGFNPNWLRIAFCAPIYWNPGLVFGTYLALGLVVLVTRYAYPDRKPEAPAAAKLVEVETTATDFAEERELIAA
jgi:phage shock protein PspC (stress-responsive transcriptional regulator)